MTVPNISPSALAEHAKKAFPTAAIAHEPISPDHGSWRLQIGGRSEERWLEFFWGPLSGFGVTDMKEDIGDDATDIFAPYHVPLESLDAAKGWLDAKAKEAPNQAAQTTPGLRPSVSDL